MVLGIIETVGCAGIIIFLLFRFVKSARLTSSKLREAGLAVLAVLLTSVIYFTCFFPAITQTGNLQKRGVETVGETVQWINTDDSRMIAYTFVLNGQTYNNTCEVVYSGKEIEGIICPAGKYVVIYDKDDPDNAVMDFKRPSK
jgi:hypothetical protein